MTNIFLWVLPNLDFWSWGFSSCVGSTQIILEGFYNSFLLKRIPINYEFYSSLFKNYSLAMSYVENLLPKPTSPLWIKPSIPFQQVSTSFRFYLYLIYPQTFFCNLVWILGIYKGSTWSFKFLSPSKLPQLVLGTLNQDPSRSTGPQFKFFKFCLLQVWTRFAIFGEIHSFSFPKNLR